MSQCLISTDLLPTAQAEAWPDSGELPSTGYPINWGRPSGFTASTRTTPATADRRDGDHAGLVRPDLAGLPAAVGATPTRVSLVPAYAQCTSPNRVHGPPDFPGNASNPDGSCNPPAQTSSQLTVGRRTPTARAPSRLDSQSWA